jgi:hypothetical protein
MRTWLVFGLQARILRPCIEECPMRFRTYRDNSRSRHFDLVGRGDDPWSVDLVVEAASFILLGGFVWALVAVCIH